MLASEPLSALPGQGRQAKPVTDCTELSLGGRGLEQLAGFERLVNLEVLWLHDNKLSCLNNLDHNIRIRQLYAHNNRLCTLKGSLLKLKFLTHLDVSHNQLKGLSKVLSTLQKLRFLQELNLQGNPCCEEPQYRLLMLSALPGLQLLDHHEVTTLERQQAAWLTAAGDVKPLAVAFGSHIPQEHTTTQPAAAPGTPARQSQAELQHVQGQTRQQQQQYSVLERELSEEVAAIRQHRQMEAAAAEAALYETNPEAAYWEHHSSLPPNPALLHAQQTWAAATKAASSYSSSSCCYAGRTEEGGALSSTGSSRESRLRGTKGCKAATAAEMGAAGVSDLAAQGCLQGTFLYRPRADGKGRCAGHEDRQVLCC